MQKINAEAVRGAIHSATDIEDLRSVLLSILDGLEETYDLAEAAYVEVQDLID